MHGDAFDLKNQAERGGEARSCFNDLYVTLSRRLRDLPREIRDKTSFDLNEENSLAPVEEH